MFCALFAAQDNLKPKESEKERIPVAERRKDAYQNS